MTNDLGASAVPGSTPSGVLEERRSSAGLLLALLGQSAMRRLRAAHTASGVSPRQFHLLALLHDRGPMGQRELGEVMDVDASVLVTLLNPLEADGLISRRRDLADRRRHTVHLTDDGRAHLADAARAQREAETALFAGLDDGRREQLRQLLVSLRDSITTTPPAACAQADDSPDC
jgi:DNA-binding MarR family transcriptional regulator